MKNLRKIGCSLAASAMIVSALAIPMSVFALVSTAVPDAGNVAANNPYGVTVTNVAGSGSLKDVIQGGVNFFLGLLGIIAVIVIIIAGFQWMTADSEDKVKEARKRLFNAIIGLIIIFAAYGIVYVVLNTVGSQFLKA